MKLFTKLHVRFMAESELVERRATIYIPTWYGWITIISVGLSVWEGVKHNGRNAE